MNEQFILKQRLQDLIGNSKVKAALFYTFNFDPKFFENYVMPLLVPEQQFINNAIVNNIFWRRLYKDRKVPPVTVFCDQYAKSPENGPMLDYTIIEVNMPSIGKNKGSFHPKNSFILFEEEGEEKLLVITGSNNITQGGWCENKECISEHVLVSNKYFPERFKKDLQQFINEVSYYRNSKLSASEDLILSFLNKRGATRDNDIEFYDSFQTSFQFFLDQHVFEPDIINEVEIISPFFKNDTVLVEYFNQKNVKVKIEAPITSGLCLLSDKIYSDYINAGVKWYSPPDERYVHSKVYRFYGVHKAYTFIGSVNFTGPAWCGVPERLREVYNIESGILYSERITNVKPLLRNELKITPLFRPLVDPENTFCERINAPAISFTINWATKTISWKGKLVNICKLVLPTEETIELNNNGSIDLSTLKHGKEILESLSRKSIIEVCELANGKELRHLYYPNQEGFEQKPLEYRLSATDILDAWDLLGTEDKILNEWLLSRLEQCVDLAQDESGKIVEDITPHKSLLNEMARHLYGIIKLEEFLFNDGVFKTSEKQKKSHGNNLRYYLFHDNVDTILSYLKDIEQRYKEEQLLGGYYWLLLTIIQNKFYNNALLKKMTKDCIESFNRADFNLQLQARQEEIGSRIEFLEKSLNIEKRKLTWALDNLTGNEIIR